MLLATVTILLIYYFIKYKTEQDKYNAEMNRWHAQCKIDSITRQCGFCPECGERLLTYNILSRQETVNRDNVNS